MVNPNNMTEDRRYQERQERFRQDRENAKLIANFLGWKYYPKVDAETMPGWWNPSARDCMKEVLALWGHTLRPKPICRSHNELIQHTHKWERIMHVAKKMDEEYNVKIELSYDIDKVYSNVVEAVKKLEI